MGAAAQIDYTLVFAAAKLQGQIALRLNIRSVDQKVRQIQKAQNRRIAFSFLYQLFVCIPRVNNLSLIHI